MPNQPRLKVSDHFVGLFRVFPRVINTIDVNLRRTALDRVIVNLRNFPRLTVSRKSLVVACLFLVGIVGYIDYLTGYERSLLLFYLLPISLAAWFGSLRLGLAIAFVSVTVWKLSDLAAGIPAVGLWNAGMAFFAPMRCLLGYYPSCERWLTSWIDAGSSYEFRLYNSDHSKLLEKVIVTKATP